MADELVTILLPVYNQSDTLKESIESIVSQTYKNWQLYILDDGSTDNPEDVVKKYKDQRIRYFKLEHNGLPKTLNYGLGLDKGEYVTWTSADNIMLPEMLTTLVKELENLPSYSAAYSGYYLIDEHGSITGENMKCPYCYVPQKFIQEPKREYWVSQLCNFGPSFLMRTNACSKAGEFDIECEGIEDVDYSIRIAKTGPVKWVRKLLYKYRMHKNSMSGRERLKEVSYQEGRVHFWEKIK